MSNRSDQFRRMFATCSNPVRVLLQTIATSTRRSTRMNVIGGKVEPREKFRWGRIDGFGENDFEKIEKICSLSTRILASELWDELTEMKRSRHSTFQQTKNKIL